MQSSAANGGVCLCVLKRGGAASEREAGAAGQYLLSLRPQTPERSLDLSLFRKKVARGV